MGIVKANLLVYPNIVNAELKALGLATVNVTVETVSSCKNLKALSLNSIPHGFNFDQLG